MWLYVFCLSAGVILCAYVVESFFMQPSDAHFCKSLFFEKKACTKEKLLLIFASTKAEVAQLVELQPSKLVVASSSLVFRSKPKQ